MRAKIIEDCAGIGQGDTPTLTQVEIASNFAFPEKSPLEEKPRMKDQRPDLTWERGFFSKLNPLCLKCAKDCKQSSQVKIIVCPQFSIQELSPDGRESEAAER
jgi:hypothetical protein